MEKIPVIAVVGPTASGKTDLAVRLARQFNAEIVSADSMQIYQGMDIATAKPTREEQRGIPHHLIDFLPVTQSYSAAKYVQDATVCIKDIISRGKTVIVCGGTGLYVDALLQNMQFEPEPDNREIRELLTLKRDREGIQSLYDELLKIDPELALTLHINNEGRIIRALEIYYLTGETATVRRKRALSVESPYCSLYLGIDCKNRQNLYNRINFRAEKMVSMGLIEEAQAYFHLDKRCTASQAIGYKEFFPYLTGEISSAQALANLQQATRNYAKRQLTWFRKNTQTQWLYRDELTDEALALSAIKVVSQYFDF